MEPSALVIVLDGVRVEEFSSLSASDITGIPGEQHAARTWSVLAPDALAVRAIQNPVLTSTVPGHAAMLTGRPEPLFTAGMDERGVGLHRPLVPTIFEAIRGQLGLGESDAQLVANTVTLPAVVASLYPTTVDLGGRWVMVSEADGSAEPDDSRLFHAVQATIEAGPPRLLVVNAHDADRAGHASGDYAGRVAEQDGWIAELWHWLGEKHPDYREKLLFLVTADHGRHRVADGADSDTGVSGDTASSGEPWADHGDACAGCRAVPFFLAGSGVAGGEVRDGAYQSTDIGATLAAFFGVELPFAQGLAIPEIDGAPDGGRSGEIDVAALDGHVAVRGWLPDFVSRSELRLDDIPLSTPGIRAAEAPVLASVAGAGVVCFREYDGEDVDGEIPWRPRCLRDPGTGFTDLDGADIGFPDAAVGPFWRPALVEREGVLWAAWLHTPERREPGDRDQLRVARWDGAWSEPASVRVNFTSTTVTAVPTSAGLAIAINTADGDPEVPYSRHVATWRFDAAAETLAEGTSFYLDEVLPEPRRVEGCALAADGDHLRLGFFGLAEEYAVPFTTASADGGVSWSEPAPLSGEGAGVAAVEPVFAGGALVWAAIDGDEALVCTEAAGCTAVGSPRIAGLASDPVTGGLYAAIDEGVGAWSVAKLR
jgi:hypothetical protein